jgi:hypothetical protein
MSRMEKSGIVARFRTNSWVFSTTSMDFDVSSVQGETHCQDYMQVQQIPNDTDPLMWWKQYQQVFPDLTRMVRQYPGDLEVPDTSVSPVRFFSRLGLVQTDLSGRLLDTTMIDHLGRDQQRGHTHTPHTHTHTTYSLTPPYICTSLKLCLAHQYTELVVLSHLQHFIPCPRLPTIKPC